jgi:hypothetical protein
LIGSGSPGFDYFFARASSFNREDALCRPNPTLSDGEQSILTIAGSSTRNSAIPLEYS